MGLKYSDILNFLLGRDSGWRFNTGINTQFSTDLLGVLDYRQASINIKNPQNRNFDCTMRRVGASVPIHIEADGMDQVQKLIPGLSNKILTGPVGRGGVSNSDINGIYASLSLGLSCESSQNITIIWFGDFAGVLSTLLLPTGYPAFLAQLAAATAVGVLPSGDSGMHIRRGYFSVGD